VDAPGELRVCGGGRSAPASVRVRDVSATGIGIEYASPLPVGQQCVVKTPTLPSDQSCLYTVVRAVPLAEGAFHIGLHLNGLASDGVRDPAAVGEQRSSAATKLVIALLLLALAAVAASFVLPPVSQIHIPTW
jgi:hypothetical protein